MRIIVEAYIKLKIDDEVVIPNKNKSVIDYEVIVFSSDSIQK